MENENNIQMYLDDKKTIKAFPRTKANNVVMEDGKTTLEEEIKNTDKKCEEKINNKIEQFGSQVTKNKNDIADNSKDIERAFETINDNSFIPFEGESVTIEHSKVGFTKDMKLEGMTYQNLIDVKEIQSGNSVVKGVISLVANGTWSRKVKFDTSMLKPNTLYTIIVSNTINTFTEGNNGVAVQLFGNLFNIPTPIKYSPQEITTKTVVVSTVSDLNGKLFHIEPTNVLNGEWKGTVLLLEGDYTNKYIPEYFEGIKSVGEKENKISILSNGKNILPPLKNYSTITGFNLNNLLKNGVQYTVTNNNNQLVKIAESKDAETYLGQSSSGKFTFTFDNSKQQNLYVWKKYEGQVIELFTNENIDFVMIEEGVGSIFEPYKSDKKEILLPFNDGLKGILNGDKDNIVIKKDGIYIVQKIYKKIFNGTHSSEWNCWVVEDKGNNWKIGAYNLGSHKPKSNSKLAICDKFVVNSIVDESKYTGVTMYAHAPDKVEIRFSISKEKLVAKGEMLTNEEINEWFKNNPTTFYYQLAEPIEHKIEGLNSINLETFKDITHVSSENEIQPNLSFKAPVDIPATISTLKAANTMLIAQNVGLENKNTELEKVNNQQTEALKDISSTTDFLIEDALTRKLNN